MLGIGGAVGAGSAMGASVGGAVGTVATLPVQVANNFIGSGVFGYTMIIGERYAFHNDWPQIQKRIDAGEKIENVFPEYAKVFMNMMIDSGVNSAKQMTKALQEGTFDFLSGDIDFELDDIDEPPDVTTDVPIDVEQRKEDAAKTSETFANITFDQTIIGSGLDKNQVKKAVDYYEDRLQLLAKVIKALQAQVQKNSTSTNRALLKQKQNELTAMLKIHAEYKKAHAWLLKNYPKKTP